ncbi:MAG: dimethylarginine dimethylaminohydrolase family protein [Caldisphaera sp.]|jgi:N-dimethylarginine dimethylaminohydrolase|nr:arginine deiminase family protein [Caldisphaera sp.]PMP60831.1 MAG: amidinotransferase [Caldisphaera sp.]PMP92288.1 MAG: amidinotransferase [Caldisphaera sp.]
MDYLDSEVGKLREVMMHVPGKELELVNDKNYNKYLFSAPNIDKEEFKKEIIDLIDLYKKEGVKVNLVQGLEDKPNAVYSRDSFLMTPKGAIISNFKYDVRKGEELEYEKALRELNYNIIKKMQGVEIFEGGNALILNSETALVGIGERNNKNGVEAFVSLMQSMGFKNILEIQTPMSKIHIDEYVSQVNEDTIITIRQLFPWDIADQLRKLGFNIITVEYGDVSSDLKARLCLNSVALAPNKIVIGEGCNTVRKILEDNAVDVILNKIDEVVKGGGGIHCVTGQLKRDSIKIG